MDMTTKELALTLGVSTDSIQNVVKKLGENFRRVLSTNNQGGYVFNEEQATMIKLELQNHSKVNALSPKTDLEKQLIIAQAMQLQQEMINELQIRAEKAENKLIEEQSYIDFAHQVTESKDYLDMMQVSKLVGLGRTRLFELLRTNKILMENNIPYQKFIDLGYFRTIETKFAKPNGDIKINIKTIVSQKGLKYIYGIVNKAA